MLRPLLLPTLALILVLPAAAQDYGVVALQDDLADGGTLAAPEPRCLAYRAAQADFVFFDETNDLLARYDPAAAAGSRTTILRSAADLDTDTGEDVFACRDLDVDAEGNVYVALGGNFDADGDQEDLVYRAERTGASGLVLTDPDGTGDVADGINGLAVGVDGNLVYLARSQFFGAPEDGLYRITTVSPAQEPEVVMVNPDFDLVGIDVAASGDLYLTSSENGAGSYVNVVLRVEDPEGSATLTTIATPCGGGSPVFENCTDGGLEDLKVGFRNGEERLFVMNNSFGATGGEEIVQFDLDGSDPETVFEEVAFLADADITGAGVTGYTTAGSNGYMAYDPLTATIYLASDDGFDGTLGIFSVMLSGGVANEPGAPVGAFTMTAWPNPATSATAVRVTVDAPQALEVAAYDLLGRRVALLFRGTVFAGTPVTARLDAAALPAGVYVVRATGDAGAVALRVAVVR